MNEEKRTMRAIVYTSNTGSTAKYAKLLSHQICVPSFSMVEAKTKVKPGAEIIYMGWIMAGKIKGYPEAARKYNIQAVCGVGTTASRDDRGWTHRFVFYIIKK